MQHLEPIEPSGTYLIVQHGNADDPLVFERQNRPHLVKLIYRHLPEVCDILEFRIYGNRLEMVLEFLPEQQLPEKYKNRLHQPLSNLFNAYAKAINKRYGRKGSLFRVRFERTRLR